MRGRGHSRYGQALVQDGIIIDSRYLGKVHGIANASMDVEAGASLDDMVRAALKEGFILPVMTDCTMLSVGVLHSRYDVVIAGQDDRHTGLHEFRAVNFGPG